MKACRCRNLLFIQLHRVLLMINQNQPSLHRDMQNSVAVSGRLTMEFRASSGFFFSPLFVSSLFSRLTSAFCLLLLWLKMLEKYLGRRGGQIYDLWSIWRAMKHLESLEVLTHLEDRMFCLQEQYLIFSHLSTSCFCICISVDSKRSKDLFFLARNK